MSQAIYSLGVLVCFGMSSLTQEALIKFRYDSFLVLVQSLSSAIAALIVLAIRRDSARPRGLPDKESVGEWALVVIAYYASHYFGLASLRHLSYPVHITFKSCKAIPVAVGERLLTRRRHSLAKSLGVLVMCVGVAAFLLLGESRRGGTTTTVGIGLVSLALAADGIYAGSQLKLVTRCPSEFWLMLHMNVWQGLLALISALWAGEIPTATAEIMHDPILARDLAAFAVSKALGTLCVYRLLREAGTLVVATVTTVRKVLSVLLSVLAFGHNLHPAQWVALVVVFTHKYLGAALANAMSQRRPPIRDHAD